jgi:hypothetical protein
MFQKIASARSYFSPAEKDTCRQVIDPRREEYQSEQNPVGGKTGHQPNDSLTEIVSARIGKARCNIPETQMKHHLNYICCRKQLRYSHQLFYLFDIHQ